MRSISTATPVFLRALLHFCRSEVNGKTYSLARPRSMSRLVIAIADALFWPIVQISISYVFVRLPDSAFRKDNLLTRSHSFEQSLGLYRVLMVPRWKKHLPDWAPIVGGKPKKLLPFNPSTTCVFLIESRRAEIAHWLQIACTASTWLWNPPWATAIMAIYAVLFSLPCILAQRYNRLLLQRRRTADCARHGRFSTNYTSTV